MKNLVLILIVVGLLGGLWVKVAFHMVPDEKAKTFVEELRLNIDNSKFLAHYAFQSPLPEARIDVPAGGIAGNFHLERKEASPITDNSKDRSIVYTVEFDRSELAPSSSARKSEYRLVLKDRGNLVLPKWEVFEFRPMRTRPFVEREK